MRIERERSYTTMADTVQDVIDQARASVPAAGQYLPSWIASPSQLWDYWKPVVRYVEDNEHPLSQYTSEDVELVQHIDTMAEYGWRGDCDCFTVLILASCGALGWECALVLQGNDPDNPSHIYPVVIWNDQEIALDLTEPLYDSVRNYRYSQLIPVDMRVRLADRHTARHYQLEDGNYAYIDDSSLADPNLGAWEGWNVINNLMGSAGNLFGSIFGGTTGSTFAPANVDQMSQFQLMQMAQQHQQCQDKLSSARTNQVLFGVGGLALGMLAGVMIGRAARKR